MQGVLDSVIIVGYRGGEKLLGECLEVFHKRLEEDGENLILNNYVLKDGTYLIVDEDGKIVSLSDIKMNKKSGEINSNVPHYNELCYFDYHSDLISMNKPQDPAKIIHSNNYLSFWVKKDSISGGKLKPEIIEKYYEILEHPEKKYEKTKAKEIYQNLEETIGTVDTATLQRNKKWILEHIFSLEESEIDMSGKDYLKIFFKADKQEYEREGNRYFIPNIYNSNNYNVEVQGEIYGLPDNNQGMNAKKPFLSVKTRKMVAPYLLNREDVMLQKQFFDYLMGFASKGQNNIYVDLNAKKFIPCKNGEYPTEAVSGFFLRIQKGKEVEILNQDVVPFLDNHLKKTFTYKNWLNVMSEKDAEYEEEQEYETYQELERIIDDIFFSKMLISYYFGKEEDIKITDETLKRCLISSRNQLFSWLHYGNDIGIKTLLNKLSMELIKGSLLKGYSLKAAKQMNMRLSLIEYFSEGGESMADISVGIRETIKERLNAKDYKGLENDREFYFVVGQMVRYLDYKRKAAKKTQSMINPFLNAKTGQVLKEQILRYYKKYNYDIASGDKKVSRLYAMIQGYEPEEAVMQDMVSLGFTMDNLLLERTVKGEKENE